MVKTKSNAARATHLPATEITPRVFTLHRHRRVRAERETQRERENRLFEREKKTGLQNRLEHPAADFLISFAGVTLQQQTAPTMGDASGLIDALGQDDLDQRAVADHLVLLSKV